MTKQGTINAAEVMIGFAEGKTLLLKIREDPEDPWVVNENPGWDWATFDYKLKEETA